MEHVKLTTVMRGDRQYFIQDNPPIENWRSVTNNSDSYEIFSFYGFPDLASPDVVCRAMTGNCDRIRCPHDSHTRDHVSSGLIPLRDHYLYEQRYLQPYKVPADRGRGREPR